MANDQEARSEETTYPIGAAVKLTGLAPDLLRVWERRYGVVEPLRTQGGSRRYRDSDIERLQLLKAAVDAGFRIGDVAGLDTEELRLRRDATSQQSPASPVEQIMAALARLDSLEAEHMLVTQLSALGPMRFSREIALPLLQDIGQAWSEDRMCIASEHLATSALRSLLGTAMRPNPASAIGPRVVFATPPGERHELGLLIAALTALGAGANPLYLGTELPIDQMAHAAMQIGADALGLSLVTIPPADATSAVRLARMALPGEVQLWLGGGCSKLIPAQVGVTVLGDLDALERRVAGLSA